MTYADTTEYLFAQLPMYQRIGKAAYKADLEGTIQLMDVLGHPELGFKSVHVAGTNGKGSTSHLIASICQDAGLKTGLYTSPHLIDFRERIRINGEMIPESSVTEFVEHYKIQFEEIGLSFFEWSVGLAFQYFKTEDVDIAIIEVGMGGRLDSTNVIVPEVSVVTNIGLDHTQYLGTSKAVIAKEKAGIFKEGVPVVVGETDSDTKPCFDETALELGCPLRYADQDRIDIEEIGLKGNHQIKNAQTAVAAIGELQMKGWQISSSNIDNGLKNVVENTGLRGRWEVLNHSPKVICDVAHNEEGVGYVVEELVKEKSSRQRIVLGFVDDKNVNKVLSLFPKDAEFYLCQASIPRAMDIDDLSSIANDLSLSFTSFKITKAAYEAALAASESTDLIFVGGSTFVVADLLTYLSGSS
ncbi:MAG: bifunctional folylpolyglutamate synthase/dihydrofolate synthase [Flavobacteriales bacterium]|nr:bifunctional folylpolyglutamate synthase/dihydrofolate synthase [Flavobacteriales bacterium]MBT3964263.1 bifunctional folylpolyglutamate synthase/dihydrofolate synthase [Flavobacteriales bacterium]MBT4705092.1 bifunctional folylpolyglutamate synthase/dihydrofolate synthase [Flavobacteriales bacterium]MBT4930112.1 bifunctional folylpolyglutamate synthase/dihydrofolate synthase [Flavobacteriales bacterium]MBT5133070.1 bifunctional folylpolyglutamate synthase/dihydrofolate synthase [Flavobacter